MDTFSAFLTRHLPQTEEVVRWDTLRFQVASYLCTELPPDEVITSVRAVVCTHHHVLIVHTLKSLHILPGGRREIGETLEQTLRREMLEESGWQIDQPHLLGVKHFHHLTPKPADYAYPYPDFVQVIYHAMPQRHLPEARQTGDLELGASLMSLADAYSLPLPPNERMFLLAALQKFSV
jgi:ADP-ribose pyrophosphatase YjhB (NUDIX family)